LPPSLSTGKPKVPSYWAMYKKRVSINIELKEAFLSKAAMNADKNIKSKLLSDRTAWLSNCSLQKIIDSTIMGMIAELAGEALNEGASAKEMAEKSSGTKFFMMIVIFDRKTNFGIGVVQNMFPVEVFQYKEIKHLGFYFMKNV
jgi:hypothetical protein